MKWIEVHDQSNNMYNTPPLLPKPIRYETSMLQSDLSYYNDVCIVVKRAIIVTRPKYVYGRKGGSQLLKDNSLVIRYIKKISHTLIDNADDLDIVVPMYNLTEFS